MVHPGFGGIQYDPATKTLYAMEDWQLWAIKKDPTPALSQSWGAVKAQYRK
jgi:hypothetical protein